MSTLPAKEVRRVPPNVGTLTILPYLMVLVSGVLWGLTFSLARIAAVDQAHPVGLAFWQACGGGVVLLLVCAVRGRWPTVNYINVKRFCVVAFFGTAIPATIYFYAVSRVPVGILAISVALVPMLTYALSWLLGIDKFSFRRFGGIFLGFVAILLLVGPDTSLPDPEMTSWVLLALVAAVFYTIENVYVDAAIPDSMDMIILLTGGLIIAGLALIPVMTALGAFVPITYPFAAFEWAILAMIVASSTAYVMFFYVIKLSGAVFASVTGYVITLCGVFWGIFLFHEEHSYWVWGALLLMLSGMSLVTPRKKV